MTNVDSSGGVPAEIKEQGNFIKFSLINKETKEPLPFLDVVVQSSDGEQRPGRSNKNGKVEILKLPDGNCSLEMIKGRDIMLELSKNHELKDGETLEILSEVEVESGNEITWEDIARFNWGEKTRDKEVANQFMRDKFDCRYYTLSGEMKYKKKDKTHEIKIPKPVKRESLELNKEYEIELELIENPQQFKCCQGIPYITFESKKSFVSPNAEKSIKKLKDKLQEYPKGSFKIMLFGHSDLVRTEEENKDLTQRRGKSLYNLLLKKPDYWVDLYKEGKEEKNEDWGIRSIQRILNYLNTSVKLDLNDFLDKNTKEELKNSFSITADKKLSDGDIKKIFKKYMETITSGIELAEEDFMEEKFAGCGSLNPLYEVEISEQENRRVTIFIFDKENLPKIPCKKDDMEPCINQTDQFVNDQNTYRKQKNFKCCFYDSIARNCREEVEKPDIIAFDGHMHIMSGHCTPIPLLWNQIKIKLRRTNIDRPKDFKFLGGLSRGAAKGAMDTIQIADDAIDQSREVHSRENKKNQKILTPLVAMAMDMSYSHVDGYKGLPVYRKVPSRYYYFKEPIVTTITRSKRRANNIKEPIGTTITRSKRSDNNTKKEKIKTYLWPNSLKKELNDLWGTRDDIKSTGVKDSEIFEEERGYKDQKKKGFYYYLRRKTNKEDSDSIKDREPVWLHPEEMDMYVDWPQQRLETIAAAIKYPLEYFPMYHYDPRRFAKRDDGWETIYKDIVTKDQPGTFVGFKMYTALGFKPLDSKLQSQLTKFYLNCEKKEIPVLCHCSPSGMCSHDIDFYYKIDKNAKTEYKRWYWFDRKKDWFYDNFVSPEAWKKQVLEKYPKLKLCLAHFGGGSSYWADWKKNTNKLEKKGLLNGISFDKEFLIEGWYTAQDNSKDNWIKQIVDIIEEQDEGKDKHPNFYTDISYHFLHQHDEEFTWLLENHPKVKDRILFGTDWYMTELDSTSIGDYIAKAKPTIDKISRELTKRTGIHEDLWLKFTRINPMKYYSIKSLAENFAEGIKEFFNNNQEELRVKCKLKEKKKEEEFETPLLILKNSDFY